MEFATNSNGHRCITTFSGSTDGLFEFGKRKVTEEDILHKVSVFARMHANEADIDDIALDLLDELIDEHLAA